MHAYGIIEIYIIPTKYYIKLNILSSSLNKYNEEVKLTYENCSLRKAGS